MSSQAVINARTRRARRGAVSQLEAQWFVEEVRRRTDLTLRQRVTIAVSYLQDRIVQNISVPVTKQRFTRQIVDPNTGKKKTVSRTVVTERSKPGEFPRADTTTLMKSIFHDVQTPRPGLVQGFVGMPLMYGLVLELHRDRSFLRRTFAAERDNLVAIVGGTPIG